MNETEKIIKRVRAKYPTAKMLLDSEKNLYIDVNGRNLSEEHLLPPTKDPHSAWESAELSLKMTQNINRTHPLRSDMYSFEDRRDRVRHRNTRKFDYNRVFDNE